MKLAEELPDSELRKRLDKIEKALDKSETQSTQKQIAKDTIRLAGRIPFARGDSQKLDLNLAMSMLTQAAIFSQSEETIDEAKKLLALARRTAR